jgi:hypothetical protein
MNTAALEWQDRAACTIDDAHLFCADKKPADAELVRCMVICARCPVQPQCAAQGLACGAPGVWAGVHVPDRGPTRQRAHQHLRRKAGRT